MKDVNLSHAIVGNYVRTVSKGILEISDIKLYNETYYIRFNDSDIVIRYVESGKSNSGSLYTITEILEPTSYLIDLELVKKGYTVKLESGEFKEVVDVKRLGCYYILQFKYDNAYRYTKGGKSGVALMNVVEVLKSNSIEDIVYIVEEVHEDLPDSILELGIAAVSEYAYLPKDALRVAFNAMIEEYLKHNSLYHPARA